MDSFRHSPSTRQDEESTPLMRPMSSRHVGSLCFIAMLSGLVALWCIVDQWNRSVGDALFSLGDITTASIDVDLAKKGIPVFHMSKPFPGFNFPLSLAFIQFAFMGLVFLMLFWLVFCEESFSWKEATHNIVSDRRWPLLVLTHIFSIFWLQALMLPTRALSLGLFAASRAAEIPATALLRAPLVGAEPGHETAQTTMYAFAGVAVLYYAYTQVAECLCIWSGHGVILFGVSFWIVYFLTLLVPAANTVLQEGVLQRPNMHPLFMLGVMNIFACLTFLPVLLLAHAAGWEDVSGAIAMTLEFREVGMLIAWLSLQMALISVITVGVILMTDSFWAVSLRALRVVYWWLQQLFLFYAGTVASGQNISVSMACPSSSKWAFVMLCGFFLVALAVLTDRRAKDAAIVKAKFLQADSKPAVCP